MTILKQCKPLGAQISEKQCMFNKSGGNPACRTCPGLQRAGDSHA